MLFIVVLLFMCLMVGIMSIGVIFSNKPLKGSCGGLNAVGIDGNCKICGKKPSGDCKENNDVLVDTTHAKSLQVYDAMRDRDLS